MGFNSGLRVKYFYSPMLHFKVISTMKSMKISMVDTSYSQTRIFGYQLAGIHVIKIIAGMTVKAALTWAQ